MTYGELPLPNELATLIARGIWPLTEKLEQRQNSRPIVPTACLQRVVPDEETIYFYMPPFETISTRWYRGEKFWEHPYAALDQIDPDRTLIIGDFGLGADSFLALDYRGRANDPSVLRLKWFENPNGVTETEFNVKIKENKWVQVSPDFGTFCREVGLCGNQRY